jgi:ATP-dependent helicase YprA (DUF1998 family)
MGLQLVFNWEQMDVFQEDEEQRAGSLLQLRQAGVPLEAAMSILGYDLNEDQEAMLQNAEVAEPLIIDGTRSVSYEMAKDLATLERHAKGRIKQGKSAASNFVSDHIEPSLMAAVQGALEEAQTAEDVEFVIRPLFGNYP